MQQCFKTVSHPWDLLPTTFNVWQIHRSLGIHSKQHWVLNQENHYGLLTYNVCPHITQKFTAKCTTNLGMNQSILFGVFLIKRYQHFTCFLMVILFLIQIKVDVHVERSHQMAKAWAKYNHIQYLLCEYASKLATVEVKWAQGVYPTNKNCPLDAES